jgi:hypothetical protein
MKTNTQTREAVVNTIQVFYDNEVLGYYPINQNTVSDIKDDDSQLYKRSINIGGYVFKTRLGALYNDMKSRCLIGGSVQKNSPHYLGTTMCNEWANSFDSFVGWASTQIGMYQVDEMGNLFELDKDLLGGGKKHYSPRACTMLPKALNVALATNDSVGYYKTSSGKYQVKLSKFGKSVYVGLYDNKKKAKSTYRKARKAYIKELAVKYKHQLSIVAYESLMSYKQA